MEPIWEPIWEPKWMVGLMTGTSLDGSIDAALLKTDGERIAEFGPGRLYPYGEDLRALLAETVAQARRWAFERPEPAIFREAEDRLTRAQAEAVRRLAEEEGPGLKALGAVGFHGQTVLHRAPRPGLPGRTRQLGDGALMSSLLGGVTVVYDFRSADMAAGGQGAPLAPVYHAALLALSGCGPETAALNLGGVANVTWKGADGTLVAFDVGPASAPIDDWVRDHGLGAMDRDGALAFRGRVDEARLAALLAHPWLDRPPPKSLDRFDFPAAMADGLSAEDGAALLTAFAAAAVGRGLDHLPQRPRRVVVSGGGRWNPALMRALEERAGVEALRAEALDWRGDMVEAECFAYLAARVLRGLPISFPGATGVAAPMTGGRVAGGKAAG